MIEGVIRETYLSVTKMMTEERKEGGWKELYVDICIVM